MFCEDCEENICKIEKDSIHKGHNLINIFRLYNDSFRYKKIIIEKNRILSNIIRFNNLILKTFEKFKNNYYHIKSVINLGKSIQKENLRDSQDIECMDYNLKNSLYKQREAIDILKKKSDIFLSRNDTFLHLYNRNVRDEEFKLISQIKFNQLKEINLSGNNIKNIEYFNKMNLPYLEYLNMSYNRIENIEPIAELNSKELKEIFLQNNEIKDLYPFLESDFPKLEILRIENNIFDKNSEDCRRILRI